MVLLRAMNGSQNDEHDRAGDDGADAARDAGTLQEDRLSWEEPAKVEAGEGEAGAVEAASPASGMAVLSFLLSGASVGGCCLIGALTMTVDMIFGLGLMVTPLLAVVGVVLGVAALRRIRRSPVPLTGRPLAIAGLFVGIIAVILQGAVLFGAVLPLRAMQLELVPVADRLVQSVYQQDLDAASRSLAAASAETLRDGPGRLAAFDAAMQQAVGTPVGAELQLRDVAAGRRLIQAARARGASFDPAVLTPEGMAASMPRPLQLIGADGRKATMIVFLDDEALDDQSVVRVVDLLLVVSEADWRAQTLLADGPAAAVARGLGLALD